MSEKSRINIPRRLFHMNTFNKSSIEKSILDIKLSKRSFICDCNRKHNTDSGSFVNESVNVVKTRNLSITFGNKTSLETLDRSIRQIFNTKHPFRAHDVGFGRARNQSSSIILL